MEVEQQQHWRVEAATERKWLTDLLAREQHLNVLQLTNHLMLALYIQLIEESGKGGQILARWCQVEAKVGCQNSV